MGTGSACAVSSAEDPDIERRANIFTPQQRGEF